MSIVASHRRIVDEAVPDGWHFFAKRADIYPLPVWLKLHFSSRSSESKKLYGVNIPWTCFWFGKEMEIYLGGAEYRQAIYKTTALLSGAPTANRHFKKVKELCTIASKKAALLRPAKLSKLRNNELYTIHENLAEAYASAFMYGLVTWFSQILQERAKDILSRRREELTKCSLTCDSALAILIDSPYTTPYKARERAVSKLQTSYRSTREQNITEKNIVKYFPELHRDILAFLRRYEWVGYDYNGPAQTYVNILRELKQKKRAKHEKPNAIKIKQTMRFSQSEASLFTILKLLSHIKDIRNATDDYIHFHLDYLYAEVAQRFAMTKTDVKFFWPEELESLLLHNTRPTTRYFKDKQNFCAAVSWPQTKSSNVYYLGRRAKRLHDLVGKLEESKKQRKKQFVKGVVAAPGYTRGRAKILLTYKDINKVKKGDVLVTYMTSPKFMAAIFRCGAIVTDEGGLTSHAAIIAREISKPCIVGTKLATHVFKDGDMIEVNTVHGVVRKV